MIYIYIKITDHNPILIIQNNQNTTISKLQSIIDISNTFNQTIL